MEIEYEGSETFAVERLFPAIERLAKGRTGANASGVADLSPDPATPPVAVVAEGLHPTTREIADKLGAEEWDDLALSACGHLALARQPSVYTQEQILEQMRLGPDCSGREMNRALDGILKNMTKRGNLEKRATSLP